MDPSLFACPQSDSLLIALWGPPIAQSVGSPITAPWNVSLFQTGSHTFVEIDHDMFFTVILCLPLIKERLLSVTSMA